ncbi:prolipoprotein diacylglyceryl transferase [Staphylococcus epidermidis]|uniref:prolipoprotein diacylglyceryl transferase n=1 Tax=Staphylococcus epidermidis TaxID=1282 RepID=UPI001C3E7B5E|nr:prolipoprotein diacylglyceryl transferase [Staphylococcus epidermidis]MBV5134091.1 prolipoprotein diacylglyceryl transferase [Staphylococcus epidermidis]
MKPLFTFGPFTLYFFGLMIAIGASVGLLIFVKEAKRRGLNHNLLLDGAIYSLIGGVLGARIIYVLVYNPSYYLSNPIEIFFIHQGGLSIHGGIIGGLLVGYLFLKHHKLPIWETLDIVAPALIIAQGISRIGCDVFGGPISSTLPWGIEFAGEYLHPAQAYEFLLDYLLFGYLWLRLKKPSYNGQVSIHYLIGYMIIRGIVEFSRVNPIVFGPFSVSHAMSLIGIIIGIVLIIYRRKEKTTIKNGYVIKKSDYMKTSLIVIAMMIISLTVYYWVQG